MVNLGETQQTSKLNIKRRKVTHTLLQNCHSKIKGAIVIPAKTNAILKRPVNKLFPIENTYQETTKRLWKAVIGKLKRKYKC